MAEKKKGKVLVIDDDRLVADMMEMDLEEDYEVRTANSGADGLAAAREFGPGIILLDVNMPDMTGLEVTRELRSYDETKETPVVVITGAAFDAATEEELKHYPNFKRMLSKMTPIADIKKVVAAFIRK